jgi:hypothetical protein
MLSASHLTFRSSTSYNLSWGNTFTWIFKQPDSQMCLHS